MYLIYGFIILFSFICTIFLFDFIWFRKNTFTLYDEEIFSVWRGIYESIKISLSNDKKIIYEFYGIDVYLHIEILRIFMFGTIQIYLIQLATNFFFNLLNNSLSLNENFFLIDIQGKNKGNIQHFIQLILTSVILANLTNEIRNLLKNMLFCYINDKKNKFKIRTMIVQTYQEEGSLLINEFNYFLDQIDYGKIEYYQFLDNHHKKYNLLQEKQFLKIMNQHCLQDQKRDGFIPGKYYNTPFYNQQFNQIDSKLQKIEPEQFSGSIFICLEMPKAVPELIQHFTPQKFNLKNLFNNKEKYEQMDIQKTICNIQHINDSIDIIWENISPKYKWDRLKIFLINIAAVCVILFFTTPSTLIHLFDIQSQTQMLSTYLSSNIINLISINIQTVLIIIFNQILIFLIRKLVHYEGHISFSKLQISTYIKSYKYLLLNMLVMPMIARKASDSLYMMISNQEFDIKKMIESEFFIDQSYNYITLIAQLAILGFINSLIRFDDLFFNWGSAAIATKIRKTQKRIQNCFDYGYQNAINITILTIIFIFSSRVPVICFYGIFYFLTRLVADTFNLLIVYKQEIESNGTFFENVLLSLGYSNLAYLILNIVFFMQNESFVLGTLTLIYSAFFYIKLKDNFKQTIYFDQIYSMQNQWVDLEQKDRKQWLESYANPNYSELERDELQIKF